MRFTSLLFLVALLAGCVTHNDDNDDPRLQGAWLSNREATVAAAAQQDPRWTNPSSGLYRLAHWYGHVVVTYSHGTEKDGEVYPYVYHYQIVEQGSNYVIIHSSRSLIQGQDIRIRFVDGNIAFWMDPDMWSMGIEERFDKIPTSPPRISRAQAIEVAKQVAVEHNEQLRSYQQPEVQFDLRTREWNIDFMRIKGEGGFTVIIDDKTGNAKYDIIYVPGRG